MSTPPPSHDSLRTLEAAAIRFRDERDWAQFHRPKDLALGLAIEAAELGELFLWKEADAIDRALAEAEFRDRLSDELADIQIFLLYLAHSAGVDLGAAVERKLAKNAAKYPVEKARGRAEKYTRL